MGIGSWIKGLFGGDEEERYEDMAKAAKKAGKANAKISLYDAKVMDKDAAMVEIAFGNKLSYQMKLVDKVLGTARARLGKSGVALGKGSALDIEVRIAREGARDTELLAYEGKTKAQRARSMAGRYRMLAKAGLRDSAAQASLLDEAASAAGTRAWFNMAQFGAKAAYSVGQTYGWWA